MRQSKGVTESRAANVVINMALCIPDVTFPRAMGIVFEADGVAQHVKELLGLGADASLIGTCVL
jgi:hypothetical protein